MYARIGTESQKDPPDAQLLSLVKGGDQAALECLLARHSEALYRYCLHLTSNRLDAEDICQEAMTRAMARVGTLESGDAFRSWLFRIARNASVDWHRRNQRLQPMPEDAPETVPSPVDGPDERVETQEEHQMVAEALSTLKESHRKVLVLREVEGMSYADIARRMNVSQSAVETLLFRARRRLKEQYGKAAFARIGAFAPIRILATRVSWPFATGVPVAAKVAVTAAVVGTAALTITQGARGHTASAHPAHRHLLASAAKIVPAAQPRREDAYGASVHRGHTAPVRHRAVRKSFVAAAVNIRHAGLRSVHASRAAEVRRVSVRVIPPPELAHSRITHAARHHSGPWVAHHTARRHARQGTSGSAKNVPPSIASAPGQTARPQSSQAVSSTTASVHPRKSAVSPAKAGHTPPQPRGAVRAHHRRAAAPPASLVPDHPHHRAPHTRHHVGSPSVQSSVQTGDPSTVSPAQVVPAHPSHGTTRHGHHHRGAHGSSGKQSPALAPTAAPGATASIAATPGPQGNSGNSGQGLGIGSVNGKGNGVDPSSGQGNSVGPSNSRSGGNNLPNKPVAAGGQGNPQSTAPAQTNRQGGSSAAANPQPTPNPQPTQASGNSGKGKIP